MNTQTMLGTVTGKLPNTMLDKTEIYIRHAGTNDVYGYYADDDEARPFSREQDVKFMKTGTKWHDEQRNMYLHEIIII